MPINNQKICFFASYFVGKSIPFYIQHYLLELGKHVETLVLICHQKDLDSESIKFLTDNGIVLYVKPNYGHDFGSWMYALAVHDTDNFNQVLFVNDSCLLVQPLDAFFNWLKHSKADLAGMINSNERMNHLQSYFLVANQKALKVVKGQFSKHGILTDKRKIVKHYELGLTQAVLSKGLVADSFVQTPSSCRSNPLFHQTLDLIKNGFPLVKKQLVFDLLNEGDIIAFKSAGIYTGSQLIKGAIVENSTFKNVLWTDIFRVY